MSRTTNAAEYRRRYYKVRRDSIIESLGGKCDRCGSVDQLEIDHIDPKLKTLSVSEMLLHKAKAVIQKELSNCQLLCRKCHLEKSAQDLREMSSGKNNPMFGRKGKASPFSKPVIDLDTNITYDSATDFANVHGLSPIKVAEVCRGVCKSVKGHHVSYIQLQKINRSTTLAEKSTGSRV